MTNSIVTIQPSFTIYDSIGETATTTTAAYALPYDTNNTDLWQTLFITNTAGSGYIQFELGGSGVTATTDSMALNAGNSIIINRNAKTHIALLASTGTMFVTIAVGAYGTR